MSSSYAFFIFLEGGELFLKAPVSSSLNTVQRYKFQIIWQKRHFLAVTIVRRKRYLKIPFKNPIRIKFRKPIFYQAFFCFLGAFLFPLPQKVAMANTPRIARPRPESVMIIL